MRSSAPTPSEATQARYETLLEVAESIASHRQLSTLFPDLSRRLSGLVSFDYMSLTLLDPEAKVVRLHLLQTQHKIVGVPPDSIPIDETPTGIAIRTRQPYYIPDVAVDERFPVVDKILL